VAVAGEVAKAALIVAQRKAAAVARDVVDGVALLGAWTGPIYGSFEKVRVAWIVWLVAMPVAITGVVGTLWHGAAHLHDKLNDFSGYIFFL